MPSCTCCCLHEFVSLGEAFSQMCPKPKRPTGLPLLLALLLLTGPAPVTSGDFRVVALQPGQTAQVDLTASEELVQIRWIGGQGRHALIIEQIGADVVIRRNNGLVTQNAPTGRNGPELVLANAPETIQVARKVAEIAPWRLQISSYPVGQQELRALEAIESAHQANSPGSASGQTSALAALQEALKLKATLPTELGLECPIRVSMAALARRLKRHREAIRAYQEASASCAESVWHAAIENGLGLTYRDNQEFDQAKAHFNQARIKGLASHNPYEAASAANNLCLILIHDGALADAKVCYERVIAEYRASGLITHVADPLLNLGATANALGELDLAIRSFEDAIAIRREAQDSSGMAKGLMNLSRAQSRNGAFQAALKSISEAQWRAELSGDQDLLANIIMIKADLHQQAGDNAALQRDVQELLGLTKNAPNPRTEALAWSLKASLMPPLEALHWLQKAERVWRHTNQPEPLSDALLKICRNAQALERFDIALMAAEESLHLADAHGFLVTKADALHELAQLRRTKRPKTALRHARAAATLNQTLGRLVEQTENEYLIALLHQDMGQTEDAASTLAEAAGLSVRALAQPLSQRHRRLQAAKSVEILSTWADWLLADRTDADIPTGQALHPLLVFWSRVNQWRNRTDQLDRKATAQLSEWRSKLLALRDPSQTEASRASLQERISWLEQQMDLLGSADTPAHPSRRADHPKDSAPPDVIDATRVLLLPGTERVYALIQDQQSHQLLTLPAAPAIRMWQARIRDVPDKLSLWSELDASLADLRLALDPARDLLVIDPEMLAIPWLGLLADRNGQMLIQHRSVRYLQAWTGTDPGPLVLHPLRLGWPTDQDDQSDPELRSLARALPNLPIQDDLNASKEMGPWILQVPGHHVIDQNDLAQAVAIASDREQQLFGPERLDEYAVPPKLVFLNACRGHSGMSGLGLLDLVARPGVRAAIVNAWDVPDAPAERFAVRFYEHLARSPNQPADALARTQSDFAKHGGRRLLREWGGYVLVELAASEDSDSRLRD